MADPVLRLPPPLETDEGDGLLIETDELVCWLGRAVWVGIIVGGFALGAGWVWLVTAVVNRRSVKP